MFKVAIVGLGLMGGSLAFALKGFKNCLRIGVDINSDVTAAALKRGAVDIILPPEEALRDADLCIFCVSHEGIINSLEKYMPVFKSGSVISDICGVKNKIYKKLSPILRPDVDYVGIHPMTGREVGGFINADEKLYAGSNFIIIPWDNTSPESIDLMKDLARCLGVSRIHISEMARHDFLIGYSSDLMHVASAALCVNYPEDMTLDFTAGAFRDCTRIANIDPELWTDLLISNKENVDIFLEQYIDNLTKMKEAISDSQSEKLRALLAQASNNKKELLKK